MIISRNSLARGFPLARPLSLLVLFLFLLRSAPLLALRGAASNCWHRREKQQATTIIYLPTSVLAMDSGSPLAYLRLAGVARDRLQY
jgi:hypothetical protein